MGDTAELIEACQRDLYLLDDLVRWAYNDGYSPTNETPERRRREGVDLDAWTETHDVEDFVTPAQLERLAVGTVLDVSFHRDPPARHTLDRHNGIAYARPTVLTHDQWAELLEHDRASRYALDYLGPTRRHTQVIVIDPDRAAGAADDIGLGAHRSREAYRQAMPPLARAELVVAVLHAGVTGNRQRLQKPAETSPLPVAVTTITHTRQRLQRLTHADVDARALRKVRHHLDEAWSNLTAVMSAGGGVGVAGAKPCRICKIREQVPKKGKRCSTCYNWKERKGYERPVNMDSTADALEAQRRRRHRRDSWGDEAFSGTSSPPIVPLAASKGWARNEAGDWVEGLSGPALNPTLPDPRSGPGRKKRAKSRG